MYSEEWDCVSGFYGKDVGCRVDRWVGYRCYQDVDLMMRWDGVTDTTIIITLALRCLRFMRQGQNGVEMKKSTP
jgi:hypothetical protein